MSKRIVFTTATPNDQGGVITDDVIDFSRFNKNPVVLKEHRWDADPLGMWTDIQKEPGGGYSGVPVFHGLTDESKRTKELYDGGWIRAASIGGQAIWKTNAAGQYELDKNGLKQCEYFLLYEISIVTLPSNEDAVGKDPIKLSAKIYLDDELSAIENSITTLASKFKIDMNKNEKPAENGAPEKKEVVEQTAGQPEKTELGAGDNLPKFLKDIVGFMGSMKSIFGSNSPESSSASTQLGADAPAPSKKPEPEKTGKEVKDPQPEPTGLSSKEADDKLKKAKQKAEEAKKKAEADDATDEDMKAYENAKKEVEAAMKECEKARAKEEEDDPDEEEEREDEVDEEEEDEEESAKKKKEKTTNSTKMNKPIKKSPEEIKQEDVKLAAAPEFKAKVISLGRGYTFSQLAADKGEGRSILNRVITRDAGEKQIEDYAVVLNALISDGKYAAIVDKTRLISNISEAQFGAFQRDSNPAVRAGMTLQQLASQLNAGYVEVRGKDNVMRQMTTLSSSDSALASPALNAIEFLPLAIFKLFPSNSWKNEIPIFAAQYTGQNTGVIWANIAADPTIYKGTQPTNPANYTYDDTAVSMALVPYWLQPMLWTPLTMHQLRYDQMSTGWSQAFAKWNAVMDDDLIYKLASVVPAGSVVKTSGLSGYSTSAQTFTISGASDPNAFYYNTAFSNVTALKKPVLNDLYVIEQIYANQNFDLESERPVIILDPTMEKFISQDPETKNMLTRWVNSDGAELVKFKHTLVHTRSRVAVYDQATSAVKDPTGAIPATSVSAALGLIPSQAGIGLGLLDVFMVQDPSSYGYKMSADIRIGIAPLRANYNGLSLYTY